MLQRRACNAVKTQCSKKKEQCRPGPWMTSGFTLCNGRLLGTWEQEQHLIFIENVKKIHSIFESIWFLDGHQGLCLYQPSAHSHFLQVRGQAQRGCAACARGPATIQACLPLQ